MSKNNGSFKINFKKFIGIIILFTIFLSVGIISVKAYTQSEKKVDLVDIKIVLNLIGEDNPINISLNENIKSHNKKEEKKK